MNMKRTLCGIVSACVAVAASAASITVDSVAQRWPWNNKLDITYTVTGGQNVAAETYARIVFTASIGTTNITIDGVHDVGASASDGTHTVTWTLPSGLKATGCTMTAQLLSADNPSGDDYMIVDLSTGGITYEGLLATQDASNTRYNAQDYKTGKLVLRKVPAGTYQTGTTGALKTSNSVKSRTTDHDYYVGVFEVTMAQYHRLTDGSSSYYQNTSPIARVSWDDLRLSGTAPNEAIPDVESNTGTFFQRLNYKTKHYFDLPTEIMFEIAMRAGTTTDFFWGDSIDWTKMRGYNYSSSAAVGSFDANAWGFYDMTGNVREWCLDDTSLAQLADASDPFAPACTDGTTKRVCRGGGYSTNSATNQYRSPNRSMEYESSNNTMSSTGFRVAYIVK